MAGITFDQIMMMRAKAMADRGLKPHNPSPQGPLAKQTGKAPPAINNAVSRRMAPVEEPTPQQYLKKLPKEVAALAVQYGRI